MICGGMDQAGSNLAFKISLFLATYQQNEPFIEAEGICSHIAIVSDPLLTLDQFSSFTRHTRVTALGETIRAQLSSIEESLDSDGRTLDCGGGKSTHHVLDSYSSERSLQ